MLKGFPHQTHVGQGLSEFEVVSTRNSTTLSAEHVALS